MYEGDSKTIHGQMIVVEKHNTEDLIYVWKGTNSGQSIVVLRMPELLM